MKKMKINEITFICVLSIAMGIFWWGNTFIYDVLKPFLKPLGLKYLIAGVWLMGAMFFGYIIRKPGSALLGEVIPAFILAFISRWGLISFLSGVVQGLTVELFFLILRYKKLSAGRMAIAGSLAAFASFFFDFFIEKYYLLNWQFNIIQLMGFVISGAILGGFLAKFTADQLQATGVLNQFEITRDGK
ncbi:MAG: ECF transporter S component [Candidatus Stygibacter australis]|nr:ECF transporter S component [Candidatus Stygibacter australis]MDP8323330.1 ECF transporter S component [Candidatus Stygibacter australis]